jgi:DNA polymerase
VTAPRTWLPPSHGAAEAVRTAAASSPDLAVLADRARGCTACPELAATRTHVVPGAFPAGARLLVLGEAPGAQEDESGLPFVGRSGQLLDALLAEVGADRVEVGVLNTVKCRPPGNRPPTRPESATCRGWTSRQLELAAPAVVVALGLSAARGSSAAGRMASLRGRPPRRRRPARAMPTYHPSAGPAPRAKGVAAAAAARDLAWPSRRAGERMVAPVATPEQARAAARRPRERPRPAAAVPRRGLAALDSSRPGAG